MDNEEYPEIPEFLLEMIRSGERIDEIRLDAEGNWFHNGQPFTNKRIIEFFNRSVNVTREGAYVIHYAEFTYPIVVEDTPVFVTGVRFEGSGNSERCFITLSCGGEEELDVRTLHYRHEGGLYAMVREGRMPAKFRRSPSFHILDRLEESEDTYFLTICGERLVLSEKIE